MTYPHGLARITVMVTRPAKQAQGLCRLIEQAGGIALCVPVIEIAEPADSAALSWIADGLAQYDLAVFVSSNAAAAAAPIIERAGGLDPATTVAAVGKGTVRACQAAGLRVDVVPDEGYNSEALLNEPALQSMARKQVIIFRGDGGRELLADTLRQRGASVTYAEVYRRLRPAGTLRALLAPADMADVDVIVVTSNEGLQNLYELAGESDRQDLLAKVLVVISPRAVQLAKDLGFHAPVITAREPSDDAIVDALIEWRRIRPNNIEDEHE